MVSLDHSRKCRREAAHAEFCFATLARTPCPCPILPQATGQPGKHGLPDFPSPLPLTAFDEYMLWDDRPKYPMSVIARLRFVGQLEHGATAEALETVVARHPLLRAKIRKTPTGRLGWIAVADRLPPIDWIDGPGYDRLPSMRPIDLFSEPGLRAWVTAGPQHSSLVLQVHHAACDGKGVSQVLDDFVRSYARLTDRRGVPDRTVAPRSADLAQAGEFRSDGRKVSADAARSA